MDRTGERMHGGGCGSEVDEAGRKVCGESDGVEVKRDWECDERNGVKDL